MRALDALHHSAWEHIVSSPRRLAVAIAVLGLAPHLIVGWLL